MTETSPVVTSTSELDIDAGSSGTLLPGLRAKLIDTDGSEITEHNKPGELLVQGPTIVLGYLNNAKATAETFVHHEDGRWIRTGDEVLVRKSAKGNEHFVVVDRIKELIKVKVRLLFVFMVDHLLTPHRVTRLLLRSSRLIFSATHSSRIAQSSRFPICEPARCPRRLSSRPLRPRASLTTR